MGINLQLRNKDMGYQQAIEATGNKVRIYKEFGSYQGDWFAILEDGRVVAGGYGSCSGCDAFQAEFDSYVDQVYEQDGKYFNDWHEEILKEEYDKINDLNSIKLKNFGQEYLNEVTTLEEIIKRYQVKVDDEYAWEDDREILNWLKSIKS